MGLTLHEIERASWLSSPLRHPTVWIPPNVGGLYVATTAMSGLPGTFSAPIVQTLVSPRFAVGAANVTINVTTGTGFTSAMALQFLVTGFDQNYDPIQEIITITGNAAATQAASGLALFSSVTAISIVGITGAASGSGASYALGIGDGNAALGTGASIRVQHPLPGTPAAAIVLMPHAGAVGGQITPASISVNGDQLVFTGTTGYGANTTSRACAPILIGIDGRTVR